MKLSYPPGATPLDDEILDGLIPSLRTQGELDEFEAVNIARAWVWAQRSKTIKKDLLSATGLCKIHQKMFEDTWKWAGKFRTRGTNIGVDPAQIQNQLGILLGDVQYWVEHKTFDPDESAVRFHHGLVKIHPFPNGNGRFSRLAADILIMKLGKEKFTWGSLDANRKGPDRDVYLQALREADRHANFKKLIAFVRQ
jgi:Fic-DOC domain mobile mystery protein B